MGLQGGNLGQTRHLDLSLRRMPLHLMNLNLKRLWELLKPSLRKQLRWCCRRLHLCRHRMDVLLMLLLSQRHPTRSHVHPSLLNRSHLSHLLQSQKSRRQRLVSQRQARARVLQRLCQSECFDMSWHVWYLANVFPCNLGSSTINFEYGWIQLIYIVSQIGSKRASITVRTLPAMWLSFTHLILIYYGRIICAQLWSWWLV